MSSERFLFIVTAVAVVFFIQSIYSSSVENSLKILEKDSNYADLSKTEGLKYDLRYASSNNFLNKNMYGNFNRPFLHKIAAEKLNKAVQLLKEKNHDLNLLIFDALRPRSVQRILWESVKGTSKQKYVANPDRGSIHNYGFAVDLTIVDKNGKELDMGTEFDDFTPLAQPRLEKKFLKEKKLTQKQIDNRMLLRNAMTQAGFIQLQIEWWHFDALPAKIVRSKYKIIE